MAKILVADDNSNIQKMVGLALKDQGIDVVAVGNGEAAVRKISDIHPDLVLADVFMPVRNGYEVCRYVKEDSALSHIPVILLVGAFDPLDEQEAQRVGADGVLKKPFVPPDPLISMVKSALARAGVSLGPGGAGSAQEKSPHRTGADILSGAVSSKLPPPVPQKLPEVVPEPIDDFPVPPAQVKIAEGQGPMAFGSLMDEAEAEAAVTAKPMIEIAEERHWNEESNDVPEEEEEAPGGGWHPSGLDEVVEPAGTPSKSTPDWREAAFHGSSPAKHSPASHWVPAVEAAAMVEAVPATPVPISESHKPEPASPFASDAWASVMANAVEEKLDAAGTKTASLGALDSHATTGSNGSSAGLNSGKSFFETAVPEEAPEVKSDEAPAIPESSWETEAKRAANLASAWDTPVAEPPAAAPEIAPSYMASPDETQDVPIYKQEAIVEAPAIAEAEEEVPQSSAYSGHLEVETEGTAAIEEPAAETTSPEAKEEPGVESHVVPNEEAVFEKAVDLESPLAHETHIAPNPEIVLNNGSAGLEAVVDLESGPTASAGAAAEAKTSTPEMDELVARVLGKMNPDVLQKVTRELLKPVIEAILRDELGPKK